MIELILQYRKAVALLVAALTAVAFFGVSKLRFQSVDAPNLPGTDPAMRANALLGDRFGGMEAVTFLVEAPDVLAPEGREAVARITEEAKRLPGVMDPQAVLSLSTLVEPVATRDQRGRPAGFELKPIPAGQVSGNALIEGFLVSRDHTAALVIASIGKGSFPDPVIGDEATMTALSAKVREIQSRYSRGPVHVYATGTCLAYDLIKAETATEMGVMVFFSLLILGLVCFFNSPTLLGVGVPLLIMLVSLTWTFGIMGFLGAHLTVISIFVAVVVMAIGSSYPIHAMAHLQEESRKSETYRVAVHLGWFQYAIPIFTVALAAALSSISLLTFDVKDIRELGVYQALGISLCFLFTFFTVPALMSNFARRDAGRAGDADGPPRFAWFPRGWIPRALAGLTGIPAKHPAFSVVFLIGLGLWAVQGVRQVVADWVIEETVPHASLPYVGYRKVVEKFGNVRTGMVVVRAAPGTSILDPAGLAGVQRIEESLRGVPGVIPLPGIGSLLAGAREKLFGRAGVPDTRAQADQLILVIGRKRLARLVDRAGETALITFRFIESGPVEKAKLLAGLQEKVGQASPPGMVARLGGPELVRLAINRYMVRNKVESILLCLLIVFILSSLIHASVRIGLIAMTPAAVAGLITFALMGYRGIYLDVATATITTIAIGVGVDFAIHYIIRLRSDLQLYVFEKRITGKPSRRAYGEVLVHTSRSYGRTIVFDAFSNLFGLSPLMFSAFPPLHLAGLLLVANQAIVIFCTFFITPLLIIVFHPDLLTSRGLVGIAKVRPAHD